MDTGPKSSILTSVIISVHNRKEELYQTLHNIVKTVHSEYEIIVVSAESTDGLEEELPDKFPNVSLIKAPDVGWGEANNIGAESARGDYLFFSGPDMQFEDGWLEELLKKASEVPNLGSIGTVLFREYPKKGVLRTGGSYIRFGGVLHIGLDLKEDVFNSYKANDKLVEVDAVHYPLIPKSVFLAVGGFDPKYFYTCDEMDLGLRLVKNRYKNVICFGKYMTTSMTPLSDKTLYFWNRNWIRMIIKLNNILLLPFLLIMPITRILIDAAIFLIRGDKRRSRLLLGALHWNFEHFSETHSWL